MRRERNHAATRSASYGYMTQYTASNPAEAVIIEAHTNDGVDTVSITEGSITAIRLDVNLSTPNDYSFVENDESR